MSSDNAGECSRVVVTGMGVLASNAHGLSDFSEALQHGVSGVEVDPSLASYKFSCQVSATPKNLRSISERYFGPYQLAQMNDCIAGAAVAAIDAVKDAGLASENLAVDALRADMGAVIGTGIGYLNTFGLEMVPKVLEGEVRRLGSTAVSKIMVSSISAHIGGILGLGGPVFTNSCACATGTDAILLAFEKIRMGTCERMIAGAAEGSGPLNWCGLEALKVLSNKYNDRPSQASRPMSSSSSGLVPGSGAAMLVVESLAAACRRGARIYAEILGGATNSGGMRNGGTMTAPSSEGVVRCIRLALLQAKVRAQAIDYINGHLTGTMADAVEVHNWAHALELKSSALPPINSTKSLLGHTFGASGAIEAVATILQMRDGFIHPSVNSEDLRPELAPFDASIPRKLMRSRDLNLAMSASFGFGDVNSCLVIKKWSEYE